MLDQLSDAVAALLPEALRHELRDNIRAVLHRNFDKMNLVTREQFDIQKKVLSRTRDRLTELEQQIAILEKQINPNREPSAKPKRSAAKKPQSDAEPLNS